MTDTPREAIACTKTHAAGTTHYHMTRAAAAGPRDEGLRKAVRQVVTMAEPDENEEGEYVAYLVPYEALDDLRRFLGE